MGLNKEDSLQKDSDINTGSMETCMKSKWTQ